MVSDNWEWAVFACIAKLCITDKILKSAPIILKFYRHHLLTTIKISWNFHQKMIARTEVMTVFVIKSKVIIEWSHVFRFTEATHALFVSCARSLRQLTQVGYIQCAIYTRVNMAPKKHVFSWLHDLRKLIFWFVFIETFPSTIKTHPRRNELFSVYTFSTLLLKRPHTHSHTHSSLLLLR